MGYFLKTKFNFKKYKKIYDERQYDLKGRPYLIVYTKKEEKEFKEIQQAYEGALKDGIHISFATPNKTGKKLLSPKQNKEYEEKLNLLYSDFSAYVDRCRRDFYKQDEFYYAMAVLLISIILYYFLF